MPHGPLGRVRTSAALAAGKAAAGRLGEFLVRLIGRV